MGETAGPRQVTILGATGSIGASTLDVIRRHSERFSVFALTAHQNVDAMAPLCAEFAPRFAVMSDPAAAAHLEERLAKLQVKTDVLSGADALVDVAKHPDSPVIMAAIVGAAGLPSALAAAGAGKRILLANKEALVMSGSIFLEKVRASGAELIPIDSEHNAIFQCLSTRLPVDLEEKGVRRILLTGSGGPFLDTPVDELDAMTPDQACNHPKWKMGRKISVDSATMMNKGLEFIEACYLFDARPENVEIVIHPQSVIHSMVDYTDGSVLAQLGNPDMRTPIANGMAWPERIESGVPALNIADIASLDFRAPDFERFPCLGLAREALETGASAPLVLNAANEVAVAAFLAGQIRFTDIATVVRCALDGCKDPLAVDLDEILSQDAAARDVASACIEAL